MATIRLPYVKEYRDRHGVVRRYFRRKGGRDIPLPGHPGSAEFMAAYQSGLEAPALPAARHPAGTFGKLVTDFYQSVDFANLKPSSRSLYRIVLDGLAKTHGHRLVRDMPKEKVRKILEGIGATRPGMANLTRAVLHRLMGYAIENNWRADNPVHKIAAYRIGTRHTWTEAQLAAFEKRWPLGTRERLAYEALLWTAQRGGDVVKMLRPDSRATSITVVQEKTGVELTIPITREFRAAITAGPSKGIYLLGDERGRPMKRPALTRLITRAANLAGLPPECTAHGLRKAQIRRLAERGRSSKQIAAVSGHKTLKEIERYTAAADQKRLAESALSNDASVRHLRRPKPTQRNQNF